MNLAKGLGQLATAGIFDTDEHNIFHVVSVMRNNEIFVTVQPVVKTRFGFPRRRCFRVDPCPNVVAVYPVRIESWPVVR